MTGRFWIFMVFFLAGAALPGPLLGASKDTAMALLTGAEAMFKQGKFAEAIDMCKRALNEEKDLPEAYLQIGACHEKLEKALDAFESYLKAKEMAAKKADTVLERKAGDSARKVCPGLMDLKELDVRLSKQLLPVAEEALDYGHLETALEAFGIILKVDPENAKAKEGHQKAKQAIEKRGDPIKAKIADATLVEVWYYLGAGDKEKSSGLAKELASRYPDTKAGKEAVQMLASNFKPPEAKDRLALKKEMIEVKAKREKVKPTTPVVAVAAPKPIPTSTGTGTGVGTGSGTVSAPASTKSLGLVDIAAVEETAKKETDALPKGNLVTAYADAFKKGKDFYSKAQPRAAEGQENLKKALTEFLRCESLYLRIEKEGALNKEVEKMQEEASMLQYGCMKMMILPL